METSYRVTLLDTQMDTHVCDPVCIYTYLQRCRVVVMAT